VRDKGKNIEKNRLREEVVRFYRKIVAQSTVLCTECLFQEAQYLSYKGLFYIVNRYSLIVFGIIISLITFSPAIARSRAMAGARRNLSENDYFLPSNQL
jgi:hypothetical protein